MRNLLKVLFSYIFMDLIKSSDTDNCGYFGSIGTKIEQALDNCFEQNVKDSRVRMSIGFELCFGFDYAKLNSTVAQPIEQKQNGSNTELIDLSLKVCKEPDPEDAVFEEEDEDQKELTEEELEKGLSECRKFFDIAIETMFDEQGSIDAFLTENEHLLKTLLRHEESIENVKKLIETKITPIDECKGPEMILRNKLIKKYLEMYLNRIASPDKPSFTWESLDVLLHPEVYMLRNDKFYLPDFKHFNVNFSPDKKKVLLPKKRTIVLQKRNVNLNKVEEKLEKESSEESWFSNLFGDSDEDESKKIVYKRKVEEMEEKEKNEFNDKPYDWGLRRKDQEMADKKKAEGVVVDDFWNPDIKIKNKRVNDEDYNKYRIKGWDVDRKLNKLFSQKQKTI
jgi:hypothetical protein